MVVKGFSVELVMMVKWFPVELVIVVQGFSVELMMVVQGFSVESNRDCCLSAAAWPSDLGQLLVGPPGIVQSVKYATLKV